MKTKLLKKIRERFEILEYDRRFNYIRFWDKQEKELVATYYINNFVRECYQRIVLSSFLYSIQLQKTNAKRQRGGQLSSYYRAKRVIELMAKARQPLALDKEMFLGLAEKKKNERNSEENETQQVSGSSIPEYNNNQ